MGVMWYRLGTEPGLTALSKIVVPFAAAGLGLASSLLPAQTVTPDSESPLIEMAHIVGDPFARFSLSCLVVYPDGRYHRERRTQISSGAERDRWEPPKVFESRLEPQDIAGLKTIIEAPDFRSIKGTIGSVRNVRPMLQSSLVFAPYEDIEILAILVARPKESQLFEITDTHLAERQEVMREFLKWVKDTESHQAARLPASAANNCSSLSGSNPTPTGSTNFPTGLTMPATISAVAPQLPPKSPKPHSVWVEFVVNPDGTVGSAVVKTHVSPDVAQSVVDAVTKWRFHPGRLLGVPIALSLEMEIKF